MLCYEEKTMCVKRRQPCFEKAIIKEETTHALEGDKHVYEEIIRQMIWELLGSVIWK